MSPSSQPVRNFTTIHPENIVMGKREHIPKMILTSPRKAPSSSKAVSSSSHHAASSSSSSKPLSASHSDVGSSSYNPPSHNKKAARPAVSSRKESFSAPTDTLLTAGTSSRPKVHQIVTSRQPSPVPVVDVFSDEDEDERPKKGRSPSVASYVPSGSVSTKIKGKGKGRTTSREDSSTPSSQPARPHHTGGKTLSSSSSSTIAPVATSTTSPPPKADAEMAEAAPPAEVDAEESDGSLTPLPSDDEEEEDDDNMGPAVMGGVFFPAEKKRLLLGSRASDSSSSQADSDDDSDDDDDESMLAEDEAAFRREAQGGGNTMSRVRGSWESVRDREGSYVSIMDDYAGSEDGGPGYYSHDDDLAEDDFADDLDDEMADANNGRRGRSMSGVSSSKVEVLSFDASGAKVGGREWSEDSSDGSDTDDFWLDNLSDLAEQLDDPAFALLDISPATLASSLRALPPITAADLVFDPTGPPPPHVQSLEERSGGRRSGSRTAGPSRRTSGEDDPMGNGV